MIAQNDGDKETLGNLKAHRREALHVIINIDCYLAYIKIWRILLRGSLELVVKAQLFKARL